MNMCEETASLDTHSDTGRCSDCLTPRRTHRQKLECCPPIPRRIDFYPADFYPADRFLSAGYTGTGTMDRGMEDTGEDLALAKSLMGIRSKFEGYHSGEPPQSSRSQGAPAQRDRLARRGPGIAPWDGSRNSSKRIHLLYNASLMLSVGPRCRPCLDSLADVTPRDFYNPARSHCCGYPTSYRWALACRIQ